MLIEFELVNLFKETRHVLATSVLVMFKWTYRILLEITKLSSTHSHTAANPRGSSGNFCCFSVNGRPVQLCNVRWVCRRPSVVPRGIWNSSIRGFSSSWVIVTKRLSDHIKRMRILTWDVPSCTTLILIIDVFQLTRLLTLNFLFV